MREIAEPGAAADGGDRVGFWDFKLTVAPAAAEQSRSALYNCDMDTVYIETTVVGNIAGRLHPDAGIAARQTLTRTWWSTASGRYRLFISQLTLDECGDGDPDAAAERIEVIREIAMLDASDVAEDLARLLMDRLAVPVSQPRDALHIATAAVHGVKFIATWNFKHILNPHLQTRIIDACREAGFNPPVICTPQQLMETESDS